MARDPELPQTVPSQPREEGSEPTLRRDPNPQPMEAGPMAEGQVLLGRYELRRELARGGMGRVLVAFDRRLNREVAVKELLDASSEARDRFEREVQVTARLQHPAIVSVYEAGTDPRGNPFYVMPQVPGRSLHEAVDAAKTLEARLALLPQVIAACEALAYAHDRGVVHRDLKPANILVGPFGETVVIDWGLAKVMGEAEPARAPSAPTTTSGRALTVAGQVMGTPGYMPPEQARGEEVDERGDVFALGAILWHLLLGGPPYTGKSLMEALAAVIAGPPPEPDWRGAPADLVAIIRKALAHDRSARYPSARALVEDLRRFQAGQLVGAHRYSSWERLARWAQQHKQLLAAAAVAALLLLILGAVALARVLEAKRVAERERAVANRAQGEAERLQQKAELDRQSSLLAQARVLLGVDPTGVLKLLTQLSPKLPGWAEARVIAEEALSGDVARWELDLPDVSRTCIIHDGHRVAFGTHGGKVLLFDLRDGSARTLGTQGAAIVDLTASDDGRELISSAEDGSAKLWELEGGQVRELSGRGVPLMASFFLQDGSTVLARRDDTLELRGREHVGAPEVLHVARAYLLFRAHEVAIRLGQGDELELIRGLNLRTRVHVPASFLSLSAASGGRLLVGREPDRGLGVIDLDRGATRWIPASKDTLSTEPALFADGSVAALVEARSYAYWEASGKLVGRGQLDCDATDISALDSGGIVVRCEDAIELLQRPLGSRRLVRIPSAVTTFVDPVASLLVQPDPRGIRIWDLRGHPRPIVTTSEAIDHLTAPPGGGPVIAFVGSSRQQVEAVQASPVGLAPLAVEDGAVRASAQSRDGERVAWISARGDRVAWLRRDTGERRDLAVQDAKALAFDPDGRALAVADSQGVKWVDLESGSARSVAVSGGAARVWIAEPRALVVLRQAPRRLVVMNLGGEVVRDLGEADARSTVSEDGRAVLAVSAAAQVELWSAADWHRVLQLDAHQELSAAAVLPSHTEVLTAASTGALLRWSTSSAQPHELTRLPRPATDLAVGRDGKTVLAWDNSGGTAAVDLASGATWILREPEGAFDDAALSLDPPGFVTARGNELRFWSDDLPRDPQRLIERLQIVPQRVQLAP